jgi:hypothetical protein
VKWGLHSSIDQESNITILISSTNSCSEMLHAVSLASLYVMSSNIRLDFCLPRWDHTFRKTKIIVVNFSSKQLSFLFLLLAIFGTWSLSGCLQLVLRYLPFETIGMHTICQVVVQRYPLNQQSYNIRRSKKRKNNCVEEKFTTIIFVFRKIWSHLGRQKSSRILLDIT